MTARDDVLRRIRAAFGPEGPPVAELRAAADRARADLEAVAPPAAPNAWRRGTLDDDVIERFVARVSEYQATVHRVTPDEVGATVDAILATAGAERVVAPAGLDPAWCGATAPEQDTDAWTASDLDAVDAVVTACATAVAETGTIVLDAGPDQGRRALTLVPDHHICLVTVDRIVASVGEGLAAVEPTAPLTLISGPSATSDIELDRVEGVHGPRRLDVVVIG